MTRLPYCLSFSTISIFPLPLAVSRNFCFVQCPKRTRGDNYFGTTLGQQTRLSLKRPFCVALEESSLKWKCVSKTRHESVCRISFLADHVRTTILREIGCSPGWEHLQLFKMISKLVLFSSFISGFNISFRLGGVHTETSHSDSWKPLFTFGSKSIIDRRLYSFLWSEFSNRF